MSCFPVPRTIKQFASRFTEAGFSVYIVGGAVRDHYLGRETSDYDFATDAEPQDVMRLFCSVIPTGVKHGTVTVHFHGETHEVTTFRSDGEYHDSRHPESVRFVRTLSEDLGRRDFTINALAVDAATGRLTDAHDGLGDLKRKIIRAIGDPRQRFSEDALRIMRACRLASQLEFTIERETAEAMASLSPQLSRVSGERVRIELFKILESRLPSVGLLAMDACGALDVVMPELTAGKNIGQKGAHMHSVFLHGVYSCDAAPRAKPLVRLAALLHDIGKVPSRKVDSDGTVSFHGHEAESERMARDILARLKCSNDERDTVLNLVRNHMFHYTPDWTDGAVRRFITRVGKDALEDLFDLRIADQVGTQGSPAGGLLCEFEQRIGSVLSEGSVLTIRDLAIDGNELSRLGIPKGPVMGVVLRQLLEAVLDDPALNERTQLGVIAKRFYEQRIALEGHSPTIAS